MSQDERILRLENAFATLSELAARSQEVDTKHEARLNTLAESNRLIVELIRRHDERMDEFRERQAESDEARRASEAELRALRAETEHKIAALVDAQIRIEETHSKGMEKLRASLGELAEAMKHLAESQAHTDRRLDALADIVRESRNGRGRDDS